MFDVYVSFETLEHLQLEDISKYFQEGIRVIKDKAKMIISTPNAEMRKHINNPFHLKEYSFDEFNKLLKTFFSNVEYYSVVKYKVKRGMKPNAIVMIAICTI